MNGIDYPEFRPPGHELRRRSHRPARWPTVVLSVLATLLVVAALMGGWWWWQQWPAGFAGLPPAAPPDTAQEVARPMEQASVAAPMQAPADPVTLDEVPSALSSLLGARTVQSLVQLDDFHRRLVVTVDNLTREAAPASKWPLAPAPGRFSVDQRGGTAVISEPNMSRYTPYVVLAQLVNAQAAVDLYRRMYPLLQQAYTELGYSNRTFNDRVVQVIDHLLATPEPATPPRVQLTEVKGPIADPRPWVRWEFADRSLESRSIGQKMLLRMGVENARIVKAKLGEIRSLLVGGKLVR